MVQYDDFWETFGRSRKNMHWEEIVTLLDSFVNSFSWKKTWKIADIGCGNGRLLGHIVESAMRSDFEKRNLSYVWLDSSKVLLSQAQKNTDFQGYFSPHWIQGDMRQSAHLLADFAPFDACFLIASFHHLESYEERANVLHQIKKLLQPHGVIYMTNWNLLHETQKKYHSSRCEDYPDGSADFLIKIWDHKRFYHAFSESEYRRLAADVHLWIEYHFDERNSLITWKLQ